MTETDLRAEIPENRDVEAQVTFNQRFLRNHSIQPPDPSKDLFFVFFGSSVWPGMVIAGTVSISQYRIQRECERPLKQQNEVAQLRVMNSHYQKSMLIPVGADSSCNLAT